MVDSWRWARLPFSWVALRLEFFRLKGLANNNFPHRLGIIFLLQPSPAFNITGLDLKLELKGNAIPVSGFYHLKVEASKG